MSGSDSDAVLSPHERVTIEAAAARIVPTDEHPGAREAGVIDYIEGLLATDEDVDTDISPREKKEYANFLLGSMGGRTEEQQATLFKLNGLGSRHRQAYRDGVAALDRLASELEPGKDFHGLDESGQDRVLTSLDERKDPFFTLLLTHTMEGFLRPSQARRKQGRGGVAGAGVPWSQLSARQRDPLRLVRRERARRVPSRQEGPFVLGRHP